jgi:ribosomal protein S18 acetylase RimI-like enzyme
LNVILRRDIEDVDWQAIADVYSETLGPEDPEQLARTWPRSFAAVMAYADDRLVGVARAISDGERESLIVGVAVLPAYQGQGVGTAMLRELTDDLQGTAILLTCEDDGNFRFYEKAGFRTHKRVMALGYPEEVYAKP